MLSFQLLRGEWYLLITSEPAKQRVRKALFICVVILIVNYLIRIQRRNFFSEKLMEEMKRKSSTISSYPCL